MNSLFVSPAVTPIKDVTAPYSNNPSFRMYQYNSRDHAVLVRNRCSAVLYFCINDVAVVCNYNEGRA